MRLLLTTFVMASMFIGPLVRESAAEGITLTFGAYQTDKPTVVYQQFRPVLDGLEVALQRDFGRPVEVRLKIFKNYDEAREALVRGTVDFVRFGPASYVLAKQQNPNIELIVMEHKKGEKRFKGLVIVAANSRIESLSDLAGHSFAFGDENSTIGRYLVQAELVKVGVRSGDLARHAFLGRHDKVAKAVILGDFDAGSVKESTYKQMNTNDELRVLASFDNVTKPWIAREGLPPRLLGSLREGLLAIKDPATLATLKASGFLPTSDDEYQFVRDGMRRSREF